MHSNNDGTSPGWKPTPNSSFEDYIIDKKNEYMKNNSGMFNTVHVTAWAADYAKKIESELIKEKEGKTILLDAITLISAPTYGTELINSEEENNEILANHFFYHQNIARKALADYNKESK